MNKREKKLYQRRWWHFFKKHKPEKTQKEIDKKIIYIKQDGTKRIIENDKNSKD